MSFFGGMAGLATGPGSSLRFASTRGRMQGSSSQGMNYPSPFFDVAHTYLPTTIKAMFRWCRYYFLTNPLLNAAVFKLSEYPITDVIIEHDSPEVVRLWTEYFHEHLRYRSFQVEVGLDYHTYGNGFPSLSYDMTKWLRCRSCGFNEQALRIKNNWIFTNNEFRLTCPKCGAVGDADVHQQFLKNPSGIRLMRWNPEDLEIEYNSISGRYTYYYTIPPNIRNDITVGRKDIVADIPQIFIQAVKENKGIIFSPDKLFHFKRPSLATIDRGWGIPLLLPVLKDVFYLQLMKKAQECVAPSTLIETSTGLVAAADVAVGDLVRTHAGQYSSVTKRAVRPMLPLRGDYAVELAITGMQQMPSTFSDNHPMYVLRRNDANRRKDSKDHQRSSCVLRNPKLYAFQWCNAGAVAVGDYVGYPTDRVRQPQSVDVAHYSGLIATDAFVYSGVGKKTALAFETLEVAHHVDTGSAGRVARRLRKRCATPKRLPRALELDEDLAYIAGWYIGDGSIGTRRVDFAMGPDDDGMDLQAAIERVFGCTFSSYRSSMSRGWTLCAFDTIFSDFMRGWLPGHAATKRIPAEILSAPDAVVLAFLRGYLEADGYTETKIRNDETVAVCCANKQLVYQLWSLLLSFGCISTVAERTSYDTEIKKLDGSIQQLKGGRPTYHWSVKSKSARRLVQLLAGTTAEVVTSGKSGFFVHGYFASRVHSVNVVDCQEVISFEVAGDHTFCVPGMATHNSILLEHIVPLRTIFPQAASGTSDPFTSVNLVDWREYVANEIARWRQDPNYIPVMPLPIGQQTIGGDGRGLLLTSEIREWSEQLCVGLSVPREFLFGGLSYAGTNVSMRMLENQFLGYIMRQHALAQWVMQEVSTFLGWPKAKIRFKPFKMADDLQRKAFLFQLNTASKLSDTSMLAECDYNQDEENSIMIKETDQRLAATRKQQLAMAEMQGEAQLAMTKYQVKAQQLQMQAQQAPVAPGEPGGPEGQDAGAGPGGQGGVQQQAVGPAGAPQSPQQPQQQPQMPPPQQQQQFGGSQLNAGQNLQQQGYGAGIDLPSMALQQARMLSKLPNDLQQAAVRNLAAQSPELAQMVQQYLAQMRGDQGGDQQGVDMRPQPSVLPPRRQ